MKSSIGFFIGISLLVLVICNGCGAEKYETDMQAAKQAMEKAGSFFAEDLAPSDWKEAMQSWEQAQAAVKEGKPSITYFRRARSRFEKTAKVAKANADDMAKEVTAMQLAIGERFAKVRSALERGRVPGRILIQLKPLAGEVEEGAASVESLASQGNYLKAKVLARDIQAKVYKAELLLSGKKLQ